jgi:hypothetical protein
MEVIKEIAINNLSKPAKNDFTDGIILFISSHPLYLLYNP